MNETRRAIFDRLKGDATLTGMLSSSSAIFYGLAPSTAAFPLIVFTKQAGTPSWQFAGAHVQADIWLVKAIDRASSANRAEDIAARVDAVLTDAPLSINDRDLLGVWRESDVVYVEAADGATYHHVGASFRLISTPS